MKRTRHRLFLLVLSVTLALLVQPTSAPAVGTCATPPTTVPVASLTPGTMATGWTAVSGTTPVPFDVEILGVLPDGIAPGLDFVMIQVSGANVDAFGGIASGMSGSPVYIGTDLVGAVSYGFSGGDHSIGGLTPAEDMVALLNYPDASVPALAPVVSVPQELRAAAATASREQGAAAFATAVQIPMPLAVSGLGGTLLNRLQTRLERRDVNAVAYRAGSASAPVTAAALTGNQPVAGEPVAAAISYGDVTLAGVGTQTLTCGNLSVAFGHPFDWNGRTSLGMNEASILKVISDPSGIWGPFKMATIGDAAGVIDQDRMAGVRGFAGVAPELTTITTHLDNIKLGTTADGQSDIVSRDWVSDVASFHLAQAIADANDSAGQATSRLQWQVNGEREDGTPFSVIRDDAYFSTGGYGGMAPNYLWYTLYKLQGFEGENISLTSIDVAGEVTEDRLTVRIRDVRSSTAKQPDLASREQIVVGRGKVITLEVELDPWGTPPPYTQDLFLKVPRRPGKYELRVFGGAAPENGEYYYSYYYGYGYSYGYGAPPDETFDDVLASLEQTSSSRDLTVALYAGPNAGTPSRSEATVQSDIVTGARYIAVKITRPRTRR